MKKKSRKTSETPRYITIRIKYYPVNTKIIIGCFFLFFFLPLIIFTQSIWQSWFTVPFVRNIYAAEKFQLNYASQVGKDTVIKADEYQHASSSRPADQVISNGPRDKKEIALTFDADMTPGMKHSLVTGEVSTYYDAALIKILTDTQTKATFFLAGMWIEIYTQETKTMAANPLFELSNHSYSHPSFDGDCYGLGEIPDERDKEELQKTQALLKSVAGVKNSYFRFPGGCYSQKDLDIVKEEGFSVVHWDVIGHDGFNHDGSVIENNIIPHVQNGSIIVLHLGGTPNTPKTAEVLPTIIAELKEKGFEFVKVSELLGKTPENNRSNSAKLPLILSTAFGL